MKKWKEIAPYDRKLIITVGIVVLVVCVAAVAYMFTYEKDIFEDKEFYASRTGILVDAEIVDNSLIIYYDSDCTLFIIINKFTINDYALCKSLKGHNVTISITVYTTNKNGALYSSYSEFDYLDVGD